VHTIISANQE